MSKQVRGPCVKLNTGHEIPLVGFGTYKITGQETVDTAIAAALEAGYRHIDTAKYYLNEAEIGNALEKCMPKLGLKREDLFLTTKVPPSAGKNATEVPRMIEESLKGLKTDYLDLVLIHYPKSNDRADDAAENADDRRECWLALENFHANGTIRSIGVSNYEVVHMKEIPAYSKITPAANQQEYHPHFRREGVQQYCKEHNIFFQAFSSLGRHKPELIEDPVVTEIAKKHNTSVPIVLLSYATSQGIGIVPKSVTPERIRINWTVFELTLADEDIKKLNSIDKDNHYIRCTGWLVK